MTFSRSLKERIAGFYQQHKAGKTNFYFQINLCHVKIKGESKYPTKAFDMGFDKGGQVTKLG